MRKLSSLLLPLAVALATPAAADPIDVTQAQKNAATFQLSMRQGARRSARSADYGQTQATQTLELAYTHYTTDGRPALYVFTTGNDGYVITAADDEARTILGYSTNGTFDPDNIPDGMSFLFDLYAQDISSLSTAPARSQRRAPAKATESVARIEPLLGEIKWDQMPPYNLYCPVAMGGTSNGQSNGGKAATGCMTTALAQIMAYYKHPAHGYGSLEFGVKEGLNTSLWSVDIYKDYYNWEKMGNHRSDFATTSSGKYNTSDPGVDGVAKLMRDLGLALRTQYGSASGAYDNRIIPALVNYFDYDFSTIAMVERKNTGDAEFERQVLEELQEKRPLYLAGLPGPGQGGHAFVCDGYDGNGLFHINWGWSGVSNDYFSLRGLDPAVQGTGSTGSGYNHDLIMVKGIRPRPEDKAPFNPFPLSVDHYQSREGTFSYPGIRIAHAGDPNNENHVYEFPLNEVTDYWFGGEMGTPSGRYMDVHARYGVFVVKTDGSREIAWDKDGRPTMMFSNFPYYDFRVNMKESWKQPGTRIYYIYKRCDKNEIQFLRNSQNQVCCFNIVTEGEKVIAKIDRTEPSSSFDFTPTAAVQQPPFFTNKLSFDYNLDSPRENRRIGTIGIQVQEQNKTVKYNVDNSKMYRNLTDDVVFKVPAGTTIKPLVTMAAGDWMHAYFYIDYNRDRNLTCNPNGLSQSGTDLAAYSYWTGDVTNGANGYNSANKSVSNSNTLDMPAFKAPETPGTYYVRFKVDWNCVDPAGNKGFMKDGKLANYIVDNGGAIVDAKLIVTDPLPEPTAEELALAAARAAYKQAEADFNAFKEWAFGLPYAAYEAARLGVSDIDFYVGWQNCTLKQYIDNTNQINTRLAALRKKINGILGIEDPDTTPADKELAAAREAYKNAVTQYNDLKTQYGNDKNADVRKVITDLTAALGTSAALPETSTKEVYTIATSTINTKVAEARTAIQTLLANAGPDPDPTDDPNLSHNSKLSGIYISYGTGTSTMLQLYPKFDPDTHLYLARRLDTDIDNAGSCWISPYYRYSIWGTTQDNKATVNGPITMQPRPNWNHLTLTCTAEDKKTTEDYHIIMLSNSGGDSTPYTYNVSDLSLMLKLLNPNFGYTDKDFSRFINKTHLENIINQILNKQ
ncbi:MAG: C10 family peptidase [Bacteroidales bacterium]|nr:C10 family peptidase [Candidatus Physcousia equi]